MILNSLEQNVMPQKKGKMWFMNPDRFQEQSLTAQTLQKFLIFPLTFWHKAPEKPPWVMRQAAAVFASSAHINIHLFV